MLYFIKFPKEQRQISIYYPYEHDQEVPVLLISEKYGIASVLTPAGVFGIEAEYLVPCRMPEDSR